MFWICIDLFLKIDCENELKNLCNSGSKIRGRKVKMSPTKKILQN